MTPMNYIHYVKLTPHKGEAITESFESQEVAQFYIKSLMKTHFASMKIVRANKYMWYARGDNQYWKIELLSRPVAIGDEASEDYRHPYAVVITKRNQVKPSEFIYFPTATVAKDYLLHRFKNDIAKSRMSEVHENMWALLEKPESNPSIGAVTAQWTTKAELIKPDQWYSSFEYCIDLQSVDPDINEHYSFSTQEEARQFMNQYLDSPEGVFKVTDDFIFLSQENVGRIRGFDIIHPDSFSYQMSLYVKAKNKRTANTPYHREKYFFRLIVEDKNGSVVTNELLSRLTYLESYIEHMFRGRFFELRLINIGNELLYIGENVREESDEDYIKKGCYDLVAKTSTQSIALPMIKD